MNGMIPACVFQSVTEFYDKMEYKVIEDKNELITNYVCKNLNASRDWLGFHFTYGMIVDGKLIGGLIFHDIRPNVEVWWTIYTENKRWCNRRMLKFMFALAFNALKCKRISVAVDAKNTDCLKLVKKLGFKQEGIFRFQRDDGGDNVVLGMLKTECKWL